MGLEAVLDNTDTSIKHIVTYEKQMHKITLNAPRSTLSHLFFLVSQS